MKKMILGCFLYGTAIGLYAQAPQGDFKGSIQIGQTTMPIVFHFGQQNGQPTTTMDSPAQGVFGFPVQSSECLSDGELTLKIPQIQFRYVGKVRSDSLIEGTVTQAGQSLPLNLVRTARKAGVSSEPERPGTPKPPFPYREEEVSVTTKDGIKLSGSLTLPEGEGPFPAVLLISGSGPQDRNEEAWKYKPFLMIADRLTRQGIAVLRMDDRGTGKSGGRYADATLQLAATDTECALDYLLRRKDIRRGKTGLAGHSMGGTIAFRMAAQRPQDVAFVLSLAGAAIPGKDLMMHQCEKDHPFATPCRRKRQPAHPVRGTVRHHGAPPSARLHTPQEHSSHGLHLAASRHKRRHLPGKPHGQHPPTQDPPTHRTSHKSGNSQYHTI